jgi:hypothetical protein
MARNAELREKEPEIREKTFRGKARLQPTPRREQRGAYFPRPDQNIAAAAVILLGLPEPVEPAPRETFRSLRNLVERTALQQANQAPRPENGVDIAPAAAAHD